MKAKMLAIVLTFGVLTLTPAFSHAYNYDLVWNFSGGLPPALSFENALPDILQLDDTHQNLRIYSDQSFSLTHPSVKAGTVVSNFVIGGDFEITLDYKVDLMDLGTQCQLLILDFVVVRSNETGHGNNYHVWNLGSWHGTIPTTDTQGTFEIKRSGASVSGWANGALIYTQPSYGTGDVEVRFNIQANTYGGWTTGALDATFDNLRIQCDRFISYKPTPVPWLDMMLLD
jgi:hypothetical protein